MGTFAADNSAGDLRISDADRDRALTELSGHYQAGRLDAEEFDERSERILRSRTGRELAAVFTDMPRQPVPAPAAEQPDGSGFRIPPLWVVAAAVGFCAIVVGSLFTHRGGFGGIGFVFLVLALGRRRFGYGGRQRRRRW